ncbi:mitochondrial carrier domain-containing protein [Talaromyces proteolyticus]|uniref:Mitochondrial carrier domain-containing protein n=1 Tax=Talaromyces proteolyticus TaxID=1131652 RepID=A0AAD4KP10_9EURO|nr:mitochondrial carrier domain-containing protein [Talaromyces proteolyticus]KAH8696234.1 mitochondrial carrier domain-containing protein [Talaromyces proteolyticus]
MSKLETGNKPLRSERYEQIKQIKYPWWFGGSASCMAVTVSHPLDLIKVRKQMQNGGQQGTTRTAISIIRHDGISGLYRGLSAGIMRQLTYGTVRIASYEAMKENAINMGIPLNPVLLGFMAGTSGFVGAIFGNPSDIANIRMQNDSALSPEKRYNYGNVFNAWRQMRRYEGWSGFRQGLLPNCFRCGLMTSCQLASYDSFKTFLANSTPLFERGEETPMLHISASLLASLVATTVCSPIDVVKTQLMGNNNSQRGSVLQVVRYLSKTDGFFWIFRGWMPSFVRLGPQTIATLVLLEQHKRIYRKLIVDPQD